MAEVWPAFGGWVGLPSDDGNMVGLATESDLVTQAGKKYWSPKTVRFVVSGVSGILAGAFSILGLK